MSQICYDIISSLLKSNNHIRGLAKDLNTNQTTIARKVRELQEANVIDFRQEGKNKVFFLRKTLEAKQWVYMAEHDRLLRAVKKYPRLRQIVETIQKNKSIGLAVLFGSYARMAAGKESDIDIYICTKEQSLKKAVEMLDSKVSVKIGEYDPSNLLIKEVEKNHIILKGVERYYEKDTVLA